MAHITEFKIDGLAGRTKPYSKKLNRDINVFFGLNGAGKTSLLRILDCAMSRNDAVQNIPFERAEVKIYSTTYDCVFTHVLEKPPLKNRREQTTEESSLPSSGDSALTLEEFQQLQGGKPLRPNRTTLWRIKPALPKGSSGRWSHGWLPTSRLYFGNSPRWRRAAEFEFSELALDNLFQETLTTL